MSAGFTQQFEKEVLPLLVKHCFKCHGAGIQENRIRFDTLSIDLVSVRAAAETWHDTLNSLDHGEMPPHDEPELSNHDHESLTSWIRQQLKDATTHAKSTGNAVVLRRLNRIEYQNKMAELLGVESNFSAKLPPDTPSEEGFQNNGATLSIFPMAFEYYLASAREGLSKAIVTGTAPEIISEKITETVIKGAGKDISTNILGFGKKIHSLAHGWNKKGGGEALGKWDQYLAQQFSRFLTRLKETEEADGNLLEQTIVLYGSSNSTTHNNNNYPLLLAGGKQIGLKHGKLLKYTQQTPLTSLHVTMLNRLGVATERFVDSTGELTELT